MTRTLLGIFAAAVAERTLVEALFALPMQYGSVNVGVLDLYRTAPGAPSGEQWRDALAAADTAALLLLGHRTDSDGGWLGHALDHRAEIHRDVVARKLVFTEDMP